MMSAGAAAAAAAARQRQEHEEEEEVTPMNSDPSGAVEYKIIRSATSAFKKSAFFQQVLEEEAAAGWELVEKLDNARLRLRRSIQWRKKDNGLTQDAYRTHVGLSETALGMRILLGVFGGIFLVVLVVGLMVA